MGVVSVRTRERRNPKAGTVCRVCGKQGTSHFPVIKNTHEACNRRKAADRRKLKEDDDGR